MKSNAAYLSEHPLPVEPMSIGTTSSQTIAKPTVIRRVSIREIIDFEVRSSWWASWISSEWMQNIAGKYYAAKVSRKYKRYKWSKDIQEHGV